MPGSSDTIRVWDVKTGHPTAGMTTGRAERNRETVVWSVALTDDLTVVSGDSRGKTCFWSAATGTLVDAYQTHAADVLSVCLSPEQDVAYSSGVDPNIVHFQVCFPFDNILGTARNDHFSIYLLFVFVFSLW